MPTLQRAYPDTEDWLRAVSWDLPEEWDGFVTVVEGGGVGLLGFLKLQSMKAAPPAIVDGYKRWLPTQGLPVRMVPRWAGVNWPKIEQRRADNASRMTAFRTRRADFDESKVVRESGRFAPKGDSEEEQPKDARAEAIEELRAGYTPIDWMAHEGPLPESGLMRSFSDVQRDAIDYRLNNYSLAIKDENNNTIGREQQGPYAIDAAAYQRCEDALQSSMENPEVLDAMGAWYADVQESYAFYGETLRGEGVNITDDQFQGLVAACSAQTFWTTPNAAEPQNMEMAVGYARLWGSNPVDPVTGKNFQELTDKEAAFLLSKTEPEWRAMPPFASEVERIGDRAHGGSVMPSHVQNTQHVMQSDGTFDGVRATLNGEKYSAFHEQIATGGNGPTSVIDSHMTGIVVGDPKVDGHLIAQPTGISDAYRKSADLTTAEVKEARAVWVKDPAGTAYAAIDSPIVAISEAHGIPVGVGQALMWGADVANPEAAGGVIRGL